MDNQQDDIRALLKDSGESTLERAIAKAKEVVDRLENITLNIAVTGETGAGKSSFVNAIRGLQEPDEGAAPTGVTETTMEPTMYPHPNMPNVKIWDLPGIGSPTFKAQTYMNDVNYQNYDFFIIVSASRFKEDDMMLANEIKKEKKNFYFVRTKTDFDVANEKRKGVTEEETLQKIRKDCVDNLRTLGFPPVFLITSHNLEKFDFQTLVKTLERDLPEYKRDALVMSLPVNSKETLETKCITFMGLIWVVALISYFIPSLFTEHDVVVYFLTKWYYSFGLDDEKVQKLSDRVNKPILRKVKESALVRVIAEESLPTTEGVAKPGVAGVMEALCSLVPAAANTASYGVLENKAVLLQEGLKELYSVAKMVIEMAELK
ncbi:interferon-inducible GTPase 5-like [Clupea harengus]|uniref:Interferon-inducible GTPase 5-like n=1 Tax=Clupea harengus TaxID=7950 RepID=A0A8M1KE71_CLUHA|nr:interferon-inducible GTPase 5-like [Clupea harengus]